MKNLFSRRKKIKVICPCCGEIFYTNKKESRSHQKDEPALIIAKTIDSLQKRGFEFGEINVKRGDKPWKT